jgi:hypothetical protein
MGILDEAIREHLELKRQHGADDSELKQLEDEAFGSPERPGGEPSGGEAETEAPTQFMAQPEGEAEIADATQEPAGALADVEPATRREPDARIADLQEAPEPVEEEQPAGEHEAVQPEVEAGPSTEERQAIAAQPTEMYDVEEEFSGGEEAAAEVLSEEDEDEDEDFWSEQRLSDELDQALEAPLEEEAEPEEEYEEPEGAESLEDEEEDEMSPAAQAEGAEPTSSGHGEEDVLEDTPDFLEESPEDDELWFEQKPPKDFDFDD